MEIEVDRLTPGMVLANDVLGKSGKPIVEKNTKLTEKHIEFIQKFLIEKVSISPSSNKKKMVDNHPKKIVNVTEKKQLFLEIYEHVVVQYKKLFLTWQHNIPLQMYDIRKMCMPLFEQVVEQPFKKIASLLTDRKNNLFYYKVVATSVLSIYLANKLDYEKKDWLQLGFAAILSDCGMSKLHSTTSENEKHPLYSYHMVKREKTLTKNAKLAILQHHELLDGSGYPSKLKEKQIHSYSKIISTSDYFYTEFLKNDNINDIIRKLKVAQGITLDNSIVKILIEELKSAF